MRRLGWSRCTAVQLLIAALVAFVALSGCGRSAEPVNSTTTASVTSSVSDLAPATPTTSLPTIAVADLPEQAQRTLVLIRDGGPFPYTKDGAVFQNREGILPRHPSGWYREYTVKKPGESDRGPWRIVTGDDGSRFWTSDHYATFEEVVA